jgi:hypothetical protein
VSKPSVLENRYLDQLGAYLRDNYIPCPIYPHLRAVEGGMKRFLIFTALFPPLSLLVFIAPDVIS